MEGRGVGVVSGTSAAYPGKGQALPPARICMPSWRRFSRSAFESGHYEAEDILRATDRVDLLELEPGRGFQLRRKWHSRLLKRDVTRRTAHVNPGLRPVRLRGEYDLFVALCQLPRDLVYVNAVEGWKDHCRKSVCVLDELWATDARASERYLHILKQFDVILLGYKGSVTAVSSVIGRPCLFMPGAVDAIRFSPYPNPPTRSIDVYSLGRRQEGMHRALLRMAADDGTFYIYDTLEAGGGSVVADYREHRELLANFVKRSRVFLVAPAKMNQLEETQGQVEVPFRFYEGAAGGAVLLGQAPDCEHYREMFDWDDVVVRIAPDGSDVAEVLARLAKEPERIGAISRRNTAETLLRHDWMYRWKEILRIVGLEPLPAMEARENRLRDLAEMARSDK
jgi:Glycosyl transferases group 1